MLPAGSPSPDAIEWQILSLAVRAAMASRAGPGGVAMPLVVVEPLVAGSSDDLVKMLSFVTSQLAPRVQAVLLTRRRSRYEGIRFSQPGLFKKVQVVEASRLLTERRPRARAVSRPLMASAARHG